MDLPNQTGNIGNRSRAVLEVECNRGVVKEFKERMQLPKLAVNQRKSSKADWPVSLFTALVFDVKLGRYQSIGCLIGGNKKNNVD
jgi:hypothetical protein